MPALKSNLQEIWDGESLTVVQPQPEPKPAEELVNLLHAYYRAEILPLMNKPSRRKLGVGYLLLTHFYMSLLLRAKTKSQRQRLQDCHEALYRELKTIEDRSLPPAIIDADDDAEYDLAVALPLGIATPKESS